MCGAAALIITQTPFVSTTLSKFVSDLIDGLLFSSVDGAADVFVHGQTVYFLLSGQS